MSAMEKAKAAVRAWTLPDELRDFCEDGVGSYAVDEARTLYYDGKGSKFLCEEVTPALLAECLFYVVNFGSQAVDNELGVRLGASKHQGLPHLPKDMSWPEGHFFIAQINLDDFAAIDVEGRFPSSGMLYFFACPGDVTSTVVHYDGPKEHLEVREYPDAATIENSKYYLKRMLDESTVLTFEPGFIFYLDGDAYNYGGVFEVIPKPFQDEVAAILGSAPTTRSDDTRLFGRPAYWQGEDEIWPDDDDDDDDDTEEVRPGLMLFQVAFGDGNIHFMINEEDLEKRSFDQCWLSYSGT